MIKTFLIRYVAGNLDRLIAFLQDLDRQIDTFVAAEAAKQDDLAARERQLADERRASEARVQTASSLKNGLRNITNG